MDRFADDGKLGQGFTSADDLVEVDIGDGDRSRPTFISAKLDSKCKQQITDLLKEYKDCFAWDYTEIKAEITKLIEAKFIRQCRYAEWISNVVPVYKKNGKLHFVLISGILTKPHRWMAIQCRLLIC